MFERRIGQSFCTSSVTGLMTVHCLDGMARRGRSEPVRPKAHFFVLRAQDSV